MLSVGVIYLCTSAEIWWKGLKLLLIKSRGKFDCDMFRLRYISLPIARNNDDVMQELEEVEAWLVHVQQWLWVEPQRMFDCHGSLTREVMIENIHYVFVIATCIQLFVSILIVIKTCW